MKIAFLGSPSAYGLFTVYRSIRAGLAPHGVEVRWVGHGIWAEQTLRDARLESERPFGEIVAPDSCDLESLGPAIVRHLIDQRYDCVLINPPQTAQEMNTVRYLPRSMLRIMTVLMMGGGTYRLCRALRDNVHATVPLSPRIAEDLISQYEFDPAFTRVIGGFDARSFDSLDPRTPQPQLRLIYFGRISDGQKGIFHLPRILDLLQGEPLELCVVGDGPDLEELKNRCRKFSERVTFVGKVSPAELPQTLGQQDVFIFPTRYEGLPSALMEAMAAGCVPVCSHLRGITDWVVRDGQTGFLFPVDDAPAAAERIRRLVVDRQLLAKMSAAAREDCCGRFNATMLGESWLNLLEDLRRDPPPISDPLPLDQWSYPRGFSRGLRGWIPERFKNVVRRWGAK
jgi:glycosyltransferase involved in cell wall biosynthesis